MPRKDRPSIEDLEEITESRYPPDPDYAMVRHERAIWTQDYWRDQERNRSDQQSGRTPLIGHNVEDAYEQRNGYDPETFLDRVKSKIVTSSLH